MVEGGLVRGVLVGVVGLLVFGDLEYSIPVLRGHLRNILEVLAGLRFRVRVHGNYCGFDRVCKGEGPVPTKVRLTFSPGVAP